MADEYIKAGRASRPLPVGLCPDMPSARDLARLATQNSVLNPSFDAGPLIPEDETEAMLILSRRQLECLRDHYDLVVQPFEYDGVLDPDALIVELRLDLCP